MHIRSNKSSKKPLEASKSTIVPQEPNCYGLACLLKSVEREIEFAKLSNRALPEKIWLKQQFSIGVNDVTRVLERMAPISERGVSAQQPPTINPNNKSKVSSVQLQAILFASDCNPRWLTKHLPSLAVSRKVPLIFVNDKKGGSLRLGQLVKLKSAIAIGVKPPGFIKEEIRRLREDRGTAVNQLIEEILRDDTTNLESTT